MVHAKRRAFYMAMLCYAMLWRVAPPSAYAMLLSSAESALGHCFRNVLSIHMSEASRSHAVVLKQLRPAECGRRVERSNLLISRH